MKYNILVTRSVDDLVEFNSEEEYTKKQLYKIIEALYYDKGGRDKFDIHNICITHSVSSGMGIEYEIEEDIKPVRRGHLVKKKLRRKDG